MIGTLGMTPSEAQRHGLAVNQNGVRRSVADLLRYPSITVADLKPIWPALGELRRDVVEQLEIDARYDGYLDRQEADIVAFRRDESLILPDRLDYDRIKGLSTEVREALKASRPATLGQAARLAAMTPAGLTTLLGHVRRGDHRRAAS